MPDGELSNHAASPACDSVCCQHGIGRPETFWISGSSFIPMHARWAETVAACPRRQPPLSGALPQTPCLGDL